MLHFSRWASWAIVAVVVVSALLVVPSFLPASWLAPLPAWVQNTKINLGLDLRGGAHFLLEVDMNTVLRQQAQTLADDVRRELTAKNVRVRDSVSDGSGATVTLREAGDRARAIELIRAFDPNKEVASAGADAIRIQFPQAEMIRKRQELLEQSIDVIRRRVDETGTKEPTIVRQGDERILMQIPGIENPDDVERVINKTAKLNFHMVDEDAASGAAPGARTFMRPTREGLATLRTADPALLERWNRARQDEKESVAADLCRRSVQTCLPVQRSVIVGGEDLDGAAASFEPTTGRPIVSFKFNLAGGRAFCRATTAGIGKRLAILLDNEIISAPVVQASICGGSGIITGQFTVQQTNELSLLLRAGALPATLTVIERRTVGADLGADAIRDGTLAAIIGGVMIAVFMFAGYGVYGLVANFAMLVNIVMVFACMALLGASLTLPGIAGIVLTLGMAVDANVLIFERVREEQALGRSPINAMVQGYERAMSAIVDANITTLIAGVLLFGFGAGPVRGFAVTLCLGLITSMFSAILLTRFIFGVWFRARRPATLNI